MTGIASTARLGGLFLMTTVLASCATPKTDEGDASTSTPASTPSSMTGSEALSPGDSSAGTSGASGGAVATAPKASTPARATPKTATGTKSTTTKTDPGPDRDSAFGPKFTIDANGKVVPIKK